jgi:hypothetical protein
LERRLSLWFLPDTCRGIVLALIEDGKHRIRPRGTREVLQALCRVAAMAKALEDRRKSREQVTHTHQAGAEA